MDIAIAAFDNMAALDAIGPFEVLAHLPDATMHWVGLETGVVRTEEGAGVGILVDELLRRRAAPRRHRDPRRSRRAATPRQRALHGVARGRARHVDVDDVGVHRLAPARRGRPARRTAGHEPLAGPRRTRRSSAPSPRSSESSSTKRQDHHRRRRVVGHRHGADARGAPRRRLRRPDDPARHRVRPPTALRRRLAAQKPPRSRSSSCRRRAASC